LQCQEELNALINWPNKLAGTNPILQLVYCRLQFSLFAYQLTHFAFDKSHKNLRLTALQPQCANFITDESDDEGFVRPKPKPIYFRHTVKPDFKELSTLSSKEYPGSGVKTFSILKVRF